MGTRKNGDNQDFNINHVLSDTDTDGDPFNSDDSNRRPNLFIISVSISDNTVDQKTQMILWTMKNKENINEEVNETDVIQT